MNEIALANFYRALNNEDRFPKEHELAEAAIAAKYELNALRAHPAPRLDTQAAEVDELAQEICSFFDDPGYITVQSVADILRNHIQHQPAEEKK